MSTAICTTATVATQALTAPTQNTALTATAERELLELAATGTPRQRRRATERLLKAHLRLAHALVRRRMRDGLDREELNAAALRGLMQAISHFNTDYTCRLSTYATLWMRQAVQREAMRQRGGLIRVPFNKQLRLPQLMEAENELTRLLGKKPTDAELAAAMGQSEEELKGVRYCYAPQVSLETALTADGDLKLEDTLADETAELPYERPDLAQLQTVLREVMAEMLTPDQQHTLERYFALNGSEARSYDAIAAELKLSRERVRQIRDAAFKRLRRDPRVQALHDELLCA